MKTGYISLLIPAILLGALWHWSPDQLPVAQSIAASAFWPYTINIIIFSFILYLHFSLVHSGTVSPVSSGLTLLPLFIVIISYLSQKFTLELAAVSIAVVAAFLTLQKYLGSVSRRSAILLSVGSFALCSMAFAMSPIMLPRAVGTYTLVTVFVGYVGLFAAFTVLRPFSAMCIVVLGSFFVLFASPNHHGVPAVDRGAVMDVAEALKTWLGSRRDIDVYKKVKKPYPIILVSSEGGGIYAAAHAYLGLSSLADRCPVFGQHVFTLVGVSGGAIGNAMFAANAVNQQKAAEPCSPAGTKIEASLMAQDHLSPIVARFLFLEIPDRVLPGQWISADRASLLSRSFAEASPRKELLARGVTSSWIATSAVPALMAVSTNMRNGRRLIFSPIQPSRSETTAEWWSPGEDGRSDLSVMDAAGISARFPWITPTALVPRDAKRDYILADGGYFENSGAETVMDLANEIKVISNQDTTDEALDSSEKACRITVIKSFHDDVEWDGCRVPVFLIHLAFTSSCLSSPNNGDGPEEHKCEPATVSGQSFLLDPLKTLLETRGARGALALERARSTMCGTTAGECVDSESSLGFFQSSIDPTTLHAPLGWFVTRKVLDDIGSSAIDENIFSYRLRESGLENDIEKLIYHFDVKLYDKTSKPQIEDLLGSP